MSWSVPLNLILFIAVSVFGQQSGSAPSPGSTNSPSAASSGAGSSQDRGSKPASRKTPELTPPRSDRVNADDLADGGGESSSKDTQIDLRPPSDDAAKHPESPDLLVDAGSGASHPWNPHKAAKSVEVGDFYFKRKNYRAAEDRYREALYYKDNDAVATFRLAICLEKLERPEDARAEYESYLKILPHGPEAETARKAIERLSSSAANAKSSK